MGDAQAVLIRAAEPRRGWEADLSGPGRLARALKLTAADNGLDLTGDALFFAEDTRAKQPRVGRSPRVNVDYALDWAHQPLRFHDLDSPAVSKPRPLLVDR